MSQLKNDLVPNIGLELMRITQQLSNCQTDD